MHTGKLIDETTGKQVPHCRVCGEPAVLIFDNSALNRCAKHSDRNPCAIEGCRRSCDADGNLNGGHYWICGPHWKIGVPPRSRVRKHYHRLWRKGDKEGWESRSGALNHTHRQRFWLFWHKVVLPQAKKFCEEGRIDVKLIHDMFGWDMEE